MARLDDNPRDAQNAKKGEKALRGFEPRLLDSECRVLTVTPQSRCNYAPLSARIVLGARALNVGWPAELFGGPPFGRVACCALG